MKVLFICNKSPWPPKEGGPMAMNMLIEGLVAAGHRVKVLAVNSYKYHISRAGIPAEYAGRTGIELIDVDLRIHPVQAFFNLFTRESYHVKRFGSEEFRKRLTAVLREEDYDVVQIETVFMCPYIEAIRQNSRARIVLRAHNIEHRIWQRVAAGTRNPVKRWYLGHLARTLKLYEERITAKVDGILAITPTDAAYFGTMHHRCISIPYGVDPAGFRVNPEEIEFPSLYSLGSMNWIPNEEGIRWFLTQVWPDVHNQFPGMKYYLAGREMPGWMRTLDLPGVVVCGEVPDAAAFIASRAIMVVPLFSGSGIRIKIIEGMAAGKAVISTRLGAEGIGYTNHENILIADAPCEFFDMISLCAASKEYTLGLGKRARALVEEQYCPAAIVQKMIAFYQELI